MPQLPFQQLTTQAAPSIVDREELARRLRRLADPRKAHTREGDALAAARRRLPMTEVPADVTVVGADGRIPFVDAFEGRRQLVGYFHMWHDGKPWEQQCEGCTFFTAQVQRPAYLHSRDATLAVFCQGTYAESRPYADFVENRLPWYSARDADALLAGRSFGFLACFSALTTVCTRPIGAPAAAPRRWLGAMRCSIGPSTVARRPGKIHLRDGRVSLAPAGNSSGCLVDQRSNGA